MYILQSRPEVRCEKKYIINEADYNILAPLLRATLKRDAFLNGDNEYYVRSLYFDTLDDKDYKEKQAALEKRQKVRLRIYDTGQGFVKLENKRKYGRYMIKHVTEISADTAKSMLKGEYEGLLAYKNDAINSIYAELISTNRVPRIIVDYHREAYVDKNMGFRINFDKRISATEKCELFNDKLCLAPFGRNGYFVLEVKYSDYVPAHIQSILSSFNLIETTYSKYVFSRLKYI
jgi:hypothetical protein